MYFIKVEIHFKKYHFLFQNLEFAKISYFQSLIIQKDVLTSLLRKIDLQID